MDLKRMGHLVALADTRHFGRAAERCHLSQPAFSRSVLAAEEALGLQLFNRGTPEITCTDAGAFVVERARKLLFESRCLERDVSMYRDRKIGDVAFGVGPYPAATLLQSLLCELRRSYPGIKTRVEVNNAQYLTEHLRNESLDFFVADMHVLVPAPDLTVTPLGNLQAGFYVRAGHPLAGATVSAASMRISPAQAKRVDEMQAVADALSLMANTRIRRWARASAWRRKWRMAAARMCRLRASKSAAKLP